MENQLHILNGDATLHSFNKSGLDGDVMVWREVLSEGPVSSDIAAAEFWDARCSWINQNMSDGEANYQEMVLAEIGKLNCPYNEYNLWFEFDLHCQINLIGAMNLLQQKVDMDEPAFYLICPAEFPGKPNFKGMGELNGRELASLYDNIRVQLTPYDFSLAAEAWAAYVTGTTEALNNFIDGTTFWANMHLLKPALEAHINRIAINAEGFNYIEQRLIDLYKGGAKTRETLYQGFWATDKIYGMGDTELNLYIDKLQSAGAINI
jgi:hypothetical protein